MTTNPAGFTDTIGRIVEIGDIVGGTAYKGTTIRVYKVVGFTPKKIRLELIPRKFDPNNSYISTAIKDSKDIILVQTGDGRPMPHANIDIEHSIDMINRDIVRLNP